MKRQTKSAFAWSLYAGIITILFFLVVNKADAYELTGPPAQTKDIQYFINSEGSAYSCEELKVIIIQNFKFIEKYSDYTFNEPQCAALEPGVRIPGGKVIGFQPATWFSNPLFLAIAANGVVINQDRTWFFSEMELRCLIYHELQHTVGIAHTSYRYSVMSTFKLRRNKDMCLPWRDDLNALCALSPSCMIPTGYISVSEDLTIMIPAVKYEGAQWSAVLRNISGDTFIIDRSYLQEDGITQIEKAVLVNDELHLKDVSYLGIPYSLVKFEITPDLKFILIRE